MTSHSTFVSSYGMVSESFKTDRLKLCFLWFDEILFEDLGRISREKFLEGIEGFEGFTSRQKGIFLETVSPVSECVEIDWMADFKDQARLMERHGFPRWGANHENYDYPAPETPEQAAHNALLRKIEAEHGVARFDDGYDIQQAEGRAGSAVNAVRRWREIAEQRPCVFQARRDEQDAMSVMSSFGRIENIQTPFTLFEATIPSLAHLEWTDIATLKINDTFRSLRSKFQDVYSANDGQLGAAVLALKEAEAQATDAIIDMSRPRPGKAMIEGILSNLPFPSVNPFSIFISLKGFFSEVQKADHHDWFYMLRDLREK